MQISIGHLHTKYRIMDHANTALTNRLDHLLNEYFQSAYEQALYSVIGDDPRVFVLRHVQVRLSLNLDAQPDDVPVVRQWVGQLVNNTVSQIAREDPFGDRLRVYENQAAYVSAFLVDVLTDHARDAWYYPSFSPSLTLGAQRALRLALTENADVLYQILGQVLDVGYLDTLFKTLEVTNLDDLWNNGRTAQSQATRDAILPLFLAALQLVDSLELWADVHTSFDQLADEFIAATLTIPDWQDRHALTMVVESALRFLAAHGRLKRIASSRLITLEMRLSDALVGLGYLDTERLSSVILDVVQHVPTTTYTISKPHNQMLADLLAVIRDVQLDRGELGASANALRLMAALAARYPQWVNDPAAPVLVSQLLKAGVWISRTVMPGSVLQQLHRGDLAGALRQVPAEAGDELRRVLALGGDGVRALSLLVTGSAELPSDAAPAWIETDCAGIFMLIRAILDIGFPVLLARVGFAEPNTLSAWLLTLGTLWAGRPTPDVQIDKGLLLFAGLDDAVDADLLRANLTTIDADQYRALQDALFRQLRLLRISTTDAFNVYPLSGEASTGWVAVDDEIGAWALADLDDAVGERRLEAWQIATNLELTLHSQPDAQMQAALGLLRSTLDDGLVDLTATLVAMNVLRVWSRWLREFAQSSVGYLLQQFIRRKGRIYQVDKTLIVELDAQPLDMVLTIAGYLDDIQSVAWLGGKTVKFRRRE